MLRHATRSCRHIDMLAAAMSMSLRCLPRRAAALYGARHNDVYAITQYARHFALRCRFDTRFCCRLSCRFTPPYLPFCRRHTPLLRALPPRHDAAADILIRCHYAADMLRR